MIVGTGRQRYPDGHAFTRRRELPCCTLELTYNGVMQRRTGTDGRFRTQPNETLLLVPPRTPYALRARQAGEEIWLIFELPPRLAWAVDWPAGETGLPELPIPRQPLGRQVLQALEDTHSHANSRIARGSLLAENALERLLLLAGQLYESGHEQSDPRIRKSLEIIHACFDRPLSVPALAADVGLSLSRFAHLFRQEVGEPPARYLESVRMEQAQRLLLRTDLSIHEVATRVGFHDPFYFSTRFRRRFRRTPSAWRRCPTPTA